MLVDCDDPVKGNSGLLCSLLSYWIEFQLVIRVLAVVFMKELTFGLLLQCLTFSSSSVALCTYFRKSGEVRFGLVRLPLRVQLREQVEKLGC